jgi:uncharacterized membrane protein YqjE
MILDGLKDKLIKALHLDNLMGNLTGYIESRMELFKLEIREDLARILSKALVYLAIALCGFLFLVFFSIGLAHFLNRYFSQEFVGYWIVAGIYIVAFLVFLVFRKDLDRGFEKHLVETIKRKQK